MLTVNMCHHSSTCFKKHLRVYSHIYCLRYVKCTFSHPWFKIQTWIYLWSFNKFHLFSWTIGARVVFLHITWLHFTPKFTTKTALCLAYFYFIFVAEDMGFTGSTYTLYYNVTNCINTRPSDENHNRKWRYVYYSYPYKHLDIFNILVTEKFPGEKWFSNLASDWLAAQLPAKHKSC